MQEKSFIKLLKNYLVFHDRKAIGYSEEEIKKIEKLYDIEVKGDFREFLRIAGRNSGGILGYGYLVFYNSFFTPRKNLIFQEFDRNAFCKIGMKNILESKIFVFSVEDETIEYFIKTSDDDFKVYKYYGSYDKIEEVSMNFDEYMRLLIYIKEPNNDNFIGDLLPKEIKNLNKNITPQKIDNYLSEDKKNDNNFIYLLKKYLEKNGKQSTGYSDEEIKEIEKFYEIRIKDDLKDFFRIAGRSDGGLLNKNDLIFYKNLTVREHVIFQWNFDEKCIIDNELYEEIKEYFLVFLINKSLYYLISIEKDVEKLYVYSYNMETQELTHTGKTFNEFMVDLVRKTNPNLEVEEEKMGEMIDIKIDDEDVAGELEEMKIIGSQEERILEQEEAEKFVLTEDAKL